MNDEYSREEVEELVRSLRHISAPTFSIEITDTGWERFYAWRPVQIKGQRKRAWLRYVERRNESVEYLPGKYWNYWAYREVRHPCE